MKIKTLFLVSSLSALISPALLANVHFTKAGYSIGTIHDEYVEFFDKENDQFLDALTYSRSNVNIFEGNTTSFTHSSLEGFNSSGFNTSEYISVADMNNDGFQDLITYPFRILINNHQGHFPSIPSPHPFTQNGDFFKIQTTDLDQNGSPDLFLTSANRANASFNGSTHLLMNVRYDPTQPNQGYFSYENVISFNQNVPPLLGNITNMKPNGVVTGDVNNDGMPDVIFLNSSRGTASTSYSSLTLNNGSGTLIYQQALSDAEDIALGDLDNDGDLDAFLARSGNQADEVWFNNGQGVFTLSGQALGADNSMNTAMADLDGDGDLDVVTTNHNASYASSHKVWLNDGDGQFTQSSFTFGAGQKTDSFKLVDVDKDGDIDIVTLGGKAQHPQNSSIYLANNEVWLNQLISNTASSDPSEGIALCTNNPNDYGLFNESQLDQAIGLAFSEGESACQADPNYYGLFDQASLDNELLIATQQGEQNCKDSPSSCNLFDQSSIDQALLLGLQEGRDEGLSAGKQFCQSFPASCGLYNQVQFVQAEENAFSAGYESGLAESRQACIDDPNSCNLYDRDDVIQAAANSFVTGYNNGKRWCTMDPSRCDLFNQADLTQAENTLLDQLIASLSEDNLKQICQQNPLSKLCKGFEFKVKDLIKMISKELPKDLHKSVCKQYSESILCDKPKKETTTSVSEVINDVVNVIPENDLVAVCENQPEALICQGNNN
ncbi:MAG: FG-GAP repeat domain-containing protein [Oleiphilus sp.]